MSPSTKRKNWSKEAVCSAIRVVRSGEIGYLRASKYFSVPRGTLERYVKDISFSRGASRCAFRKKICST
jgi:hypothetical protein